jgi:hypothetical protein
MHFYGVPLLLKRQISSLVNVLHVLFNTAKTIFQPARRNINFDRLANAFIIGRAGHAINNTSQKTFGMSDKYQTYPISSDAGDFQGCFPMRL